MQPNDRRVVLTCMAHPDDAEILCGGTLVRLAEAGWEIHIASATPGDCGTTHQDPWQISACRTAEARQAAELIGGRYHCLDERDGYVVYDKPTLAKVMDLFREVAPTLVFTHAPKDYMMDHEMVHLLVRGASFMHGCPNVTTRPLQPGTCIPHVYYCDPVEGLDPQGAPAAYTTLIDISAVIERKTDLLACHASQRDWLRAHHGMDEYLEAMKRHAAWRGQTAGVAFAEAFVQHRGHAYPRHDLLKALFATPHSH